MKKEVLVSVIVPAYNCKDFIEECISSILKQTLKAIEIIIINDGSTDGSGTICENLKNDYKEIILIHQNNQGVSGARNIGIENANGKYITFVDSDDYIANDYIEKLYNMAESKNYDLVSCGGTFIKGKKESFVADTLSNLNGSVEDLICGIVRGIGGTVWGKLIKTSIVKANNVRFNEELLYREDLLFWLNAAKHISKYEIIQYYGYYYRLSEQLQSLSTRYDDKEFEKQLLLTDYIKMVLIEQKITDKKVNDIVGKNVTQLVIGTILKQIRSGNSSISEIKKIINNSDLALYKKFMKINSLKDLIFIYPIKYNIAFATYYIYKLRCLHLKRSSMNSNNS